MYKKRIAYNLCLILCLIYGVGCSMAGDTVTASQGIREYVTIARNIGKDDVGVVERAVGSTFDFIEGPKVTYSFYTSDDEAFFFLSVPEEEVVYALMALRFSELLRFSGVREVSNISIDPTGREVRLAYGVVFDYAIYTHLIDAIFDRHIKLGDIEFAGMVDDNLGNLIRTLEYFAQASVAEKFYPYILDSVVSMSLDDNADASLEFMLVFDVLPSENISIDFVEVLDAILKYSGEWVVINETLIDISGQHTILFHVNFRFEGDQEAGQA